MQRQIGDYELVQQLGYGSLGETYLASHRLLKRQFVLKILPQELSNDPEFIQRFKEKVAILGQCEHPHVAKIVNAIESDGVHALVIEPVLNAIALNQANLSEDEILDLFRKLGSALDEIHRQGMSHGSIKLTNVLLQPVKSGFEPFWTDVALSEIINPSMVLSRVYHYVAAFLERHGRLCLADHCYKQGPWDFLGASALQHSFCERFFFLAPEQKQGMGKGDDLRAADRYAFGVLAYYLLTSEFPEGAFCPPSKKVPSLKYQWDRWILSLLSPDPLARPANILSTLEEDVVYSSQVLAVQKLKVMVGRSQQVLAGVASEPALLKPMLRPQEITRPVFDQDPAASFQVDNTISTYRPSHLPRDASEIEPLLTAMVVISEGTYVRGSNQGARDEMPRHAVTVGPFAIDVHPVTNEQFVLFLEALGGEKDAQNNDIIRLKDSRIRRSSGRLVIESGYERHPVVGVTWYGSTAYAKWVGKRLPTEAEWEIAASAGREDGIYPNGHEIDRTQANFFSSDTTAVQSYPQNPCGLFDMAGNVYEWCQDWYDYHYYDVSAQEPVQPKGPSQGVYRVLRGGCWKSSKEDLRCAHRHRNNPGALNGTYGFRCAADVTVS